MDEFESARIRCNKSQSLQINRPCLRQDVALQASCPATEAVLWQTAHPSSVTSIMDISLEIIVDP